MDKDDIVYVEHYLGTKPLPASSPSITEKDEEIQDEGKVGYEKSIEDNKKDSLGLIKANGRSQVKAGKVLEQNIGGPAPPISPVPSLTVLSRRQPPSSAPRPPCPDVCPPPPPPPPPHMLSIVCRYNDLFSLNSGDSFRIPAECSLCGPILGCFMISRHSRPALHGYADIIAAKDYQWVFFDGTPVTYGKPGRTAVVAMNYGRAMTRELNVLQGLGACYCIIVQTVIEDNTRCRSDECGGSRMVPGSTVFEVRVLLSAEQACMAMYLAGLQGVSTIFSYVRVPNATKETVMAYASENSNWQVEEGSDFSYVF